MNDTPRTDVSAFNIIDATDEYQREHVYCSDGEYVGSNFARQLEREIAELERELAGAKATMMAAAVEIQEHWDAHCDDEGYGPANLMRRLEEGFCAAGYAYTAETVVNLRKQIETIRNDTLEESARVCETAGVDTGSYEKMDYYRDCADAIRKLKKEK